MRSQRECKECKRFGPPITIDCPRCGLSLHLRDKQRNDAACHCPLCVAKHAEKEARLFIHQLVEQLSREDFLRPRCDICSAKLLPGTHRLLLTFEAGIWCGNCVADVARKECRFGKHKGSAWKNIVRSATKSYCVFLLRNEYVDNRVKCYIVHALASRYQRGA